LPVARNLPNDRGWEKELKVIVLPPDVAKDRAAYSHYIFKKTEQGEKLREFVDNL
jgi:hypothetical protein